MDAKSYEEMFLSTLGRRLKTVHEKKKHYEYMKKSIQFVYSIAALIFTSIGILISAMSDARNGHIPYPGLIVYVVCGLILLGLMIFLLYYMEANISYYEKRISDLELKVRRVEQLRLVNEQFSDIKIGFSNDWFLDSLKEVGKFNEDFTFQQDRNETINLIKRSVNNIEENDAGVVEEEPIQEENNIIEKKEEESKPDEFDLIKNILSKKLF
jgi:hypothetical protein